MSEPRRPDRGSKTSMQPSTPDTASEVDRYLRTGESDPNHLAWPGWSFLERVEAGRQALEDALVAEVHRLAGRHPVSATAGDIDALALTRRKVEPMVRGLFPGVEREAVLHLVERSVVFLGPHNVEAVLRRQSGWPYTAWALANLYLGSIGAELLGEAAPLSFARIPSTSRSRSPTPPLGVGGCRLGPLQGHFIELDTQSGARIRLQRCPRHAEQARPSRVFPDPRLKVRCRAAGTSGRVPPLVPVVEPTHTRKRDDLSPLRRPRHHGPRLRWVLPEGEMAAVDVVVGDILPKQAMKVPVAEDHDVVKQVSACRSDPPLRHSVLPRAPVGNAHRLRAEAAYGVNHSTAELRVPVEDEVPRRRVPGERVAELLDHPGGGGVRRHSEVQDLPPAVVDHEEHVEDPEGSGRDREEVHGRDLVPVVAQEGLPALDDVGRHGPPGHVPGHGPLGDDEAQLEQLGVDAGRTPGWVLPGEATDEVPDLSVHLRAPGLLRARPPAPEGPEARPMPADDGGGLDDLEHLGPAGPDTAQEDPEEPVDAGQLRAGALLLEGGDLLAEREVFEDEVRPRTGDGSEGVEQEEE